MPSIWFLEIENIRLKLFQLKTNSSASTLKSQEPQFTTHSSLSKNNSDYFNLNDTWYADYEYEVHVPVKMPELPDELKVMLLFNYEFLFFFY